MTKFLDLLKLRLTPLPQTVDLTDIKVDIQALFKETSKNKYRIEEVDIRLSNLELLVKDLFKKIN